MSNFVDFRDSQNLHVFEVTSVMQNTWHTLSGSQCATCQVHNGSIEFKCGAHMDMRHLLIGGKSKVGG